ncbi:MAG TPA: hypothetical protein VKP08_16435 [Anaerolineales bacterium]|nr:hypothetical protein [Anaerolineales bacterium]
MPKRAFALEESGEKRLEISWKSIFKFKDITVSLDGAPIGVIPDQKALLAGQEFQLTDRSIIKVQLVRKFESAELQVFRNGQPLPGSASDPQTRLKSAYLVVYFIAAFNILLSLFAILYNSASLQRAGFSIGSLLEGLVYLVLGFFIQRKSSIAMILAIVLFVADGIFAFYFGALRGANLSGEAIMIRIFFLIPMFQGIGAIKTLKTNKQ